MARNTSGKSSGGPSRIRFVMVEAEIADGDIGQITTAIQNALKSAAPVTPQRIAPASNEKAAQVGEVEHMEAEAVPPVEELGGNGATAAQRQRSPRKPAPTPEVLNGIDFSTEESLAAYAAKASPTSHRQRCLVVAGWFHDHRALKAITADHLYTAYRHLKWPLDVKDFSQSLRDLKQEQYFTSPERGQFAINHLGLQEVSKMLLGTAT